MVAMVAGMSFCVFFFLGGVLFMSHFISFCAWFIEGK